ncbi:hypothetical protein [Pseudoalteromonas sp. GutCa3]|uniref:hypothetical protein n=1 Tax=Pseudoalteromonas sp. GutCa3 TaxID=888433 RepID=UPI000C349CB4|nr:hypothetical protein [Pseudoalteromonas sp. GutCa3]PKG68611.1 hypothetical protein CXF64_20020 [Pseudoalteromonas sp. GutCa3]
MRLNQNPLVKGIIGLMIFIPVAIYFTNSDDATVPESTTKKNANELPSVTENEAIASLSGYLTTVEDKQKGITQKIDQLVTKDDLTKIISDAAQKNPTGQTDVVSLEKTVNSIVAKHVAKMQKKLISENTIQPSNAGNIDDELPFGEEFDVNISSDYGQKKVGANPNQITWDYPLGHKVEGENGVVGGILSSGDVWGSKASNFGESVSNDVTELKQDLERDLKPIPYATIHSDSSYHNATALTALIGRIERDGKSHSPFRFQVALSGDSLLANNHHLPEVANAIISGQAIGDKAFSCVRGYVTSITFNFSDGRIYNQTGTFSEPLAELADKWGNPCIKGVAVDDIGKYLAIQGAAAGISSFADTVAKQQQEIVSTGNNAALDLTGSAGKLAAGSFISGGLNKTSETLSERFESYYEAIYVQPGMNVSVLFLQDINIDYKPTNRKVSYEENSVAITSLY